MAASFPPTAGNTFGALDQACTFSYGGAFKELAGIILLPGVHCATSFHLTNGVLTLNGAAGNTWIFKSASDLIITGGAASRVDSPSCNVWWRVVSSATFDAGSSLRGNILADTSVTLAAGARLSGRAFARTAAVTLSSNAITACVAPLVPPVVLPPTVTKAFNPASITAGDVSRLTITLNNPNAAVIALTALFTDTLPGGVLVAPVPALATTCGGAAAAPVGGPTVTLANGSTIPAAGSCTIAVNVTAAAAGSYLNTIPAGALQTSAGNNLNPATATLVANAPPTVTKAFNPASITAGDVSRLTITLNNPNAAVIALTAAFTDTLPNGVVVASGANSSTDCGGGTVVAPIGGSTVTVAAGSTIPAAGYCTIGVNVTAAAAGTYLNTIPAGALQTTTGNNAAPATATLTFSALPIPVPTLPEWAMIALTALLALAGFAAVRRRTT